MNESEQAGQPPVPPYGQAPHHPGHPPQSSSARVGLSMGAFFAGVLYVIVVPGVMVTVGSTLWPEYATPGLIFTGLVTLTPPIALLVPSRTRRFAAYMLVGMAVTLIVLAGVAVAFIALLTSGEGS